MYVPYTNSSNMCVTYSLSTKVQLVAKCHLANLSQNIIVLKNNPYLIKYQWMPANRCLLHCAMPIEGVEPCIWIRAILTLSLANLIPLGRSVVWLPNIAVFTILCQTWNGSTKPNQWLWSRFQEMIHDEILIFFNNSSVFGFLNPSHMGIERSLY